MCSCIDNKNYTHIQHAYIYIYIFYLRYISRRLYCTFEEVVLGFRKSKEMCSQFGWDRASGISREQFEDLVGGPFFISSSEFDDFDCKTADFDCDLMILIEHLCTKGADKTPRPTHQNISELEGLMLHILPSVRMCPSFFVALCHLQAKIKLIKHPPSESHPV